MTIAEAMGFTVHAEPIPMIEQLGATATTVEVMVNPKADTKRQQFWKWFCIGSAAGCGVLVSVWAYA